MIIAIEGGDQAGKKTQAALLVRALRRQKKSVASFSFPDYRTPVGQEISKYFEGKRKFSPHVIHCLLAANRWERRDDITAAASRYSFVIMNRYYHSNLVYGLSNGLSTGWLENLDRGLPKSDMVMLLDVSQGESFQRKKTNRDRFEKNRIFLQRTLRTYRTVAKKQGWKVIDASRPKGTVHQDIMNLLRRRLTS